MKNKKQILIKGAKTVEILNQYNFVDFMKFIPSIKKKSDEWRIIEVSLSGETKHNILYIAKRLQLYFLDNETEGKIFICNSKEVLILAHTGIKKTPAHIKKELVIYLPEYSCDVAASGVTMHEIETIKLKLEDITKDFESDPRVYNARKDRSDNLIIVADDDMFMRSLVVKTMKKHGKVIEVENGNEVVDKYLEHLPDILFLDIHMPGVGGLQVLDEILSFDQNAFIIMLSADSNKYNVLTSQLRGAKGFITKPFTEDKLMDVFKKCPTLKYRK